MKGKQILVILLIMLIALIIITGLYYILIGNDSDNKANDMTKPIDLVALGEQKYLEFLWMVDGAFNEQRYNYESFKVNGKSLEKKMNFTCIYDDVKEECQGVNFEDNFNRIFASNIGMNVVYGDGVASSWYRKSNNMYIFRNENSCDGGRMPLDQKIELVNKEDDKLTYKVTYDEEILNSDEKNKRHFEKSFILVNENDIWKVSEAYYHDPCHMDYSIK